MTIDETKEYLDSIMQVVSELLIKRQIFLDFYNALTSQHADNNLFVCWCLENYRDIAILNLCKILEPRKDDIRKRTLRYFINFWQQPENYNTLRLYLKGLHIVLHDRATGEEHIMSIADDMLAELDAIDFKNCLVKVQTIHDRLKIYRNTKLCHNDCREIEVVLPQINEINEFITEIEDMIVKYFHIFCRRAIVLDNLKMPQVYANFNLHLD